ncbi:MAG: uracil-DNA glycosylase [Thermoguttaceae bacterium]|nr:uracil-DNA glycosylase [Thermoguttaceae bacterium]MDW8038212.1 uracil-DNA glycosylase [Thermoguttaceae bacterium]
MSPQEASGELLRMLRQQLESWQRAGLTHLPKLRLQSAGQSSSESQLEMSPGGGQDAVQPSDSGRSVFRKTEQRSSTFQEDRAAALARLAAQVARCRRCPELVRNRTQTVFGSGNPYAQLVFIGEAPGADEDRLGQPFVGAAGQLLTDMIEKGMGLRRSDVYIMNIVRCRPPGNRTPLPEEAQNCRPFLEKQLAIIQPKFICCLGACAAQNLLGTTEPISRLRGKVHSYQGIPVVCTYHPAYLLRTPSAKRQTWEDLQLLMAIMGLPVPKTSVPKPGKRIGE